MKSAFRKPLNLTHTLQTLGALVAPQAMELSNRLDKSKKRICVMRLLLLDISSN